MSGTKDQRALHSSRPKPVTLFSSPARKEQQHLHESGGLYIRLYLSLIQVLLLCSTKLRGKGASCWMFTM